MFIHVGVTKVIRNKNLSARLVRDISRRVSMEIPENIAEGRIPELWYLKVVVLHTWNRSQCIG
jgi:hypothetical protein